MADGARAVASNGLQLAGSDRGGDPGLAVSPGPGPNLGVQLELVNEDEDWIERKKHGEFRARPMFNRQLSALYYGIRDADTGE